jgi:hypothetical protein
VNDCDLQKDPIVTSRLAPQITLLTKNPCCFRHEAGLLRAEKLVANLWSELDWDKEKFFIDVVMRILDSPSLLSSK